MTTQKSPYTKNFTDHYLQLAILEQLATSTSPLRFSELKEDGLENSLFMYHMNKLIKRGIVEKRGDEGFILTPKGANWLNLAGIDKLEPKLLPRPLVQLIIRHDNKLLLSVRQGQMGEFLNKYLLPGGLHKYGVSADQTAVELLAGFFPHAQLPVPTFVSVAEMITTSGDDAYHVVSHIYTVNLSQEITPVSDQLFGYVWISLDDVNPNNPELRKEQLLLKIVEKIRTNALQTREVFQTKLL